MSQQSPIDPFFGKPPESVRLPQAPLIKVLTQVRFPAIMSVTDRAFVAAFHERLRKQYPVLAEGTQPIVNMTPAGITTRNVTTWRFSDPSNTWAVSLSNDFVSLETSIYGSRTEFVERAAAVLRELGETISPSHFEFAGLRFVNRGVIDETTEIATMIRPQLVGSAAPVRGIVQALSDVRAQTAEGGGMVRWGNVPPMTSHDPAVAPGLPTPTWFLDVDAHTAMPNMVSYDPEVIVEALASLADRAYAMFRWAVSDTFLDRFSKTPVIKAPLH